jgi:acetyl esterase/lipase
MWQEVDAEIVQEIRAINDGIVATLEAGADKWSLPLDATRAARARGEGVLPLPPKSPRAESIVVQGRDGSVPLRIVAPEAPRAAYLHIHGGGWVFGAADQQDSFLERLAGQGIAAVSVEYRLAPEHPWPAGPDDCEAAALWLAGEGAARFGTDRVFIGGESAGGHLAAVTLLRLRDRHGLTPFAGANLVYGAFDLGLTPSVRRWGDRPLVLNTRDIRLFANHFLSGGGNVDDPDVSPLHADLAGMPPAIFTVGGNDPLRDDTLFMQARWRAAGHEARLRAWPEAPHGFINMESRITGLALGEIDRFLLEHL